MCGEVARTGSLVSYDLVRRRRSPSRRVSCPESTSTRVARGIAEHLPHHGFPPGTKEARVERQARTPGKPPSPAMSRPSGGAFVVVRARESRVHGEGRQ